MWSHALKELSSDGQRLFLTLTLLPNPVSSDVLQIAYTSQKITRSESFLDSLRSLEDSFINIVKISSYLRGVGFRNPSFEDFAKIHLDGNTDWLDILLSSPRYYEQVQLVFDLAMAQSEVRIDPKTRLRKDTPVKYPGIAAWAQYRSSELIEIAINLLGGERAEIFGNPRRTRLGRLLEVVFTYGMPTDEVVVDKLRVAVKASLNPPTQTIAEATLELLLKPRYRALIDKLVQDKSAALMRANILDKDGWKFTILSKLDKILELDMEQTWLSWGNLHGLRQVASSES